MRINLQLALPVLIALAEAMFTKGSSKGLRKRTFVLHTLTPAVGPQRRLARQELERVLAETKADGSLAHAVAELTRQEAGADPAPPAAPAGEGDNTLTIGPFSGDFTIITDPTEDPVIMDGVDIPGTEDARGPAAPAIDEPATGIEAVTTETAPAAEPEVAKPDAGDKLANKPASQANGGAKNGGGKNGSRNRR